MRRSEYLSALEKQFGASEGRTVWDDLRQVKAADSPVSVPGTFSYGEASGSAMPGNVVDDGSFEPYELGGPKLAKRRSLSMSNALLIGAKKSVRKHPIFVAGPQVGYFWPEFFVELDLHGGGTDTRGASFPGIGYVVVGRGKDYAWSPMSSHSDIVDQFVETLCGGDDFHYLYKGECRATFCGHGDQAACVSSLWEAIHAAGDEVEAAQGANPAAWRADATAERIRFVPGLLGQTMRWTNRPTFQQVISFSRHRPR